jgi:hypothetical protein
MNFLIRSGWNNSGNSTKIVSDFLLIVQLSSLTVHVSPLNRCKRTWIPGVRFSRPHILLCLVWHWGWRSFYDLCFLKSGSIGLQSPFDSGSVEVLPSSPFIGSVSAFKFSSYVLKKTLTWGTDSRWGVALSDWRSGPTLWQGLCRCCSPSHHIPFPSIVLQPYYVRR